MKWKIKEAERGDAVRVKLGALYHYGIYVSDDEVIQFGLPPTPDRRADDVEVLASPIEDFLAGGFLEVGEPDGMERRKKRKNDKVVELARARIGEKGYDLIRNNCEHFVNSCVFGSAFSTQTDSGKEKFGARTVDVYVARFPFQTGDSDVYPRERADEIAACGNADVREQKFYVWKLLEYALMRSFGIDIKSAGIKQKRGKWVCSACEFSLSHSGDAVAVAVSKRAVGVDIEKFEPTRFGDGIRQKILTADEAERAARMTEEQAEAFANELWTVKEAAYKSGVGKSFAPKRIETKNITRATKRVATVGGEYILTVVSRDAERAAVKIYGENIAIADSKPI